MTKPIKIKEKVIGEEYPTFLIAEIACAHQYSQIFNWD